MPTVSGNVAPVNVFRAIGSAMGLGKIAKMGAMRPTLNAMVVAMVAMVAMVVMVVMAAVMQVAVLKGMIATQTNPALTVLTASRVSAWPDRLEAASIMNLPVQMVPSVSPWVGSAMALE